MAKRESNLQLTTCINKCGRLTANLKGICGKCLGVSRSAMYVPQDRPGATMFNLPRVHHCYSQHGESCGGGTRIIRSSGSRD